MKQVSLQTAGMRAITVLFYSTLLFAASAARGQQATSAGIFQTPVTLSDLDESTYTAWVAGEEKPMATRDPANPKSVIRWPLTTQTSKISTSVLFGDSKTPGVRHLRVGFNSKLPVESILTAGDVQVSVLKPDSAYPGNLGNEDDWIPAERLVGSEVTTEQSPDASDLALWVLPPGTQTRALRFSHTAETTQLRYAGTLGGAAVLPVRAANLAPQAQVLTVADSRNARRLNDEMGKNSWANLDEKEGDRAQTVAEAPEPALLIWPRPVKVRGFGLVFPGFGSAEVDIYNGPADKHPREAGAADWKKVTHLTGFKNTYSSPLGIVWADLGTEVTTRAIRLRFTSVTDENHPHMQGDTREGKRVWLNEWLALTPLADAPLTSAAPAPATSSALHAPIPIKFTLPEAGFVTLVIENDKGMRVRNLISETPFPAGQNTAWWDGTDDLGRDTDAAMHGAYRIPPRLVAPGNYSVRGLWRKEITPIYEFAVYNNGNPPWNTDDHTGAWLANHSAPQAAVFVPAAQSPINEPVVMLGSYVTEGPDGLAWVDLKGVKRGGKKWIGGNWTAAPFLARDAGPSAISDHRAYVASAWETGKKSGEVELRITALTATDDKPILKQSLGELAPGQKPESFIGGIAAYNGIIAASLTSLNRLDFVEAATGKILGNANVESPRGVYFDAQGRLLVLSGKQLLRFADISQAGAPETLIRWGLEEPVALTLDNEGNILISDRGTHHQVKVFSPVGKLIRAIGEPGVPQAGPYNPLHLNNPAGLAVDSENRLWVTEADSLPKRVSVWTLDGKLIRAYYGPSKYGGGGTLDPRDQNKFYYADEKGSMEFKLNWEKGSFELTSVFYRKNPEGLKLPFRAAGPETALYRDDARYFTNCFNSSPTGGHSTATLFQERNGIARPVAIIGNARQWDVLKTDEFRPLWPEGADLTNEKNRVEVCFIWSDLNADEAVQPTEVTLLPLKASGITVMPDLSFVVARLNEQCVQFSPTSFTDAGIPVYSFEAKKVLAEGVLPPGSSGGNQALVNPNGNTILSLGIAPFARDSLSGATDAQPKWSYPSPWPGLHAAHRAPRPTEPGQLIGTTRLLGGFVTPKDSGVGPIWGINGNFGRVYLFTSDGLLVASVFEDTRMGNKWRMPIAQRGMSLKGVTMHEENFWPTLNATPDGEIFLVDGSRTSLIRLAGMDSLRAIPASPLTVSPEDLTKAQTWLDELEIQRQKIQGTGVLAVQMLNSPPTEADWKNADWVPIDQQGVKANFNSDSRPYDVKGAVAVGNGKLYASWQSGDPKLLTNSGEQAIAPFKTGGALDLMIATGAGADPARKTPAAGDLRLLVTEVNGQTKAVLYRAVVPGTKDADKVPFSSPWRTITFDRVDDVSAQVALGKDAMGNFEVSVPLELLGLKPQKGTRIQGDIGILRGNGGETILRTYWSNKATGIVSDVPAEAQLAPAFWGYWEFQ